MLNLLAMLLEFVFTRLVKLPAFLVDLILKPGHEARSNKWLLALQGMIFYGILISLILLAIMF
ncbi:MAG: hypothetical protein ACKVHE_27035 [Planctomycetales bacterium]|jgi:hypothetical protein